jgi:hypothetical protein
MATPSLFPIFLKAQSGGTAGAAGTQYIETFGLEVLEMIEVELIEMDVDVVEMIEVELIEMDVDVEVVDITTDIEILEVIDVEILC